MGFRPTRKGTRRRPRLGPASDRDPEQRRGELPRRSQACVCRGILPSDRKAGTSVRCAMNTETHCGTLFDLKKARNWRLLGAQSLSVGLRLRS